MCIHFEMSDILFRINCNPFIAYVTHDCVYGSYLMKSKVNLYLPKTQTTKLIQKTMHALHILIISWLKTNLAIRYISIFNHFHAH